MEKKYRHKQFGTLVLVSLIIGICLVLLISFNKGGSRPLTISLISILFICILLFYSLTVEIEDGILKIRFGIGLIQKKIDLTEVESAKAVRNHWYYGWGIRLTPHGWLFNVSGLDAVEISLSSGKTYRIGTDRPQELTEAINGEIKNKKS
ncbi:MAG: hypothetical protein ACMUHX_01210 [bacterium]